MAIDCIINLDCKVKETLSLEGMLNLIKNRNRAVMAHDFALNKGKNEEEALDYIFKVQVATPDGKTEQKEIRVRDLFESSLPLDNLKNNCINCPANKPGETFGCYQVINYPISNRAEQWLIKLSKNALEKGLPNSLLLNYINDRKVKGELSDSMRKDASGLFFELKKPLEIVVKKTLLQKKVANTNQIFDMLFSAQLLSLPHMMTILYFSGGLTRQQEEPEEGSCQQAVNITSEDKTNIWLAFNLEDNENDDESISMMKKFFRTVFTAYGLQKEIIIWS